MYVCYTINKDQSINQSINQQLLYFIYAFHYPPIYIHAVVWAQHGSASKVRQLASSSSSSSVAGHLLVQCLRYYCVQHLHRAEAAAFISYTTTMFTRRRVCARCCRRRSARPELSQRLPTERASDLPAHHAIPSSPGRGLAAPRLSVSRCRRRR